MHLSPPGALFFTEGRSGGLPDDFGYSEFPFSPGIQTGKSGNQTYIHLQLAIQISIQIDKKRSLNLDLFFLLFSSV